MNKRIQQLMEEKPLLQRMSKEEEIIWINPDRIPFVESAPLMELTLDDILDASARLERFAPFIKRCFPETMERNGIIESVLTPIPGMKSYVNRTYQSELKGNLLLKQDSHLAIAGSIKARGGIYEVLKHTEELALKEGLIQPSDNYAHLADPNCREFFHRYTIQVGSTGNLGMSIGIMSAAIGYHVVVHMSVDAKQWKKDLLRSHGVTVVEYASNYSEAVKQGRALSNQNPFSYFVDDENSRTLFLGYAVAALRLTDQLTEKGITVDEAHPLFVYIPCGVGGAPGGVTFGLKQVFGDHVHCFFVEPVQAPCMAAGMISGLQNAICVQDIGLSGLTHADGLAVGRASGFVGGIMKPLLSGELTIKDALLYDYMRDLLDTENIFLEPSACAAFQGPIRLFASAEGKAYLQQNHLTDVVDHITHIAWATGGSLVPAAIREEYIRTHL